MSDSRHIFDSYKPHQKQIEYHAQSARFSAMASGIRAGKTYSACREFMRRICLDRANNYNHDILQYWAVAPTYKIGFEQRRQIFDLLGGVKGRWVHQYLKSDAILQLRGNVQIEFKSTKNYDSLVAVGLRGMWLDEPARMPEEAYHGGLRGRVIDYPGAWIIASGTPLGRNWYYNTFVEQWKNSNPDYSVHSWRTCDNTSNPNFAIEYERARLEYPIEYFNREYNGSFDAFVNQVYHEFRPEIHVTDWIPNAGDIVANAYAVDWGFRDPAVCLWIPKVKYRGDVVYYIGKEIYESGLQVGSPDFKGNVPPNSFIAKVKAQREQIAAIVGAEKAKGYYICDPSEPAFIDAFKKAGLFAIEANNEIKPGIDLVARAIHPREVLNGDRVDVYPGLISHRSCKNTNREFLSYEWSENKKEVPKDENNHAMDDVRYRVATSIGGY